MKGLVVNVIATAIAFAILVKILPSSMVSLGGGMTDLVILALIAGVVNALIKPVVKMLSFPISLMTLGLLGQFGIHLVGFVQKRRAKTSVPVAA